MTALNLEHVTMSQLFPDEHSIPVEKIWLRIAGTIAELQKESKVLQHKAGSKLVS